MDEVIVIVLLATLFAICFGAVEIYIRLNDDKKTIWLWTEIVSVALMLFFGSLTVGLLTYLGLNFFSGIISSQISKNVYPSLAFYNFCLLVCFLQLFPLQCLQWQRAYIRQKNFRNFCCSWWNSFLYFAWDLGLTDRNVCH